MLKKLAFSACVSLLLVGPAWAQGICPAIAPGAVLTAGQWNACFSAKQNTLGFTPLNAAGGVATGPIVTAPSLTSAAGFNIPAGTAPSVPNNGDVWTTASGMFVQIGGVTIGPLGGASASSFAATAPLSVSFPAGVTTYALTSPIFGSTAAGGTTTLESTNNGSPSGDVLNLLGTTVNLRTPNNSGVSTINFGNAGATSAVINIAGGASGSQQWKPAAAASGTITWPAGTVDFSATGGASQVVKQASSGGIFTVGQVTFGEIANQIQTGQFPTVPGIITLAMLNNAAANTLVGNVTTGSAARTDFTIDGLTLKASPAAGDEIICWDVAGAAIKKCTVSGIGTSSGVSSIAGNTGAFTLGGLLSNSTNLLQVVAVAKSDQTTGTSNILAVTPLHQQDHDSAAKVWASITGSSGAIQSSYNVSGVVRNSTGDYTVSFTTAFANTNYATHVTVETVAGPQCFLSAIKVSGKATGSVEIIALNSSFAACDPTSITVVAYGRQ